MLDRPSVDLAVNLGGLVMKNPVTVASGTFGSGLEYDALFDVATLGAVTTKGVSTVPWAGNPSPRIAETASGMLNSIGLQNPGVEVFCSKDLGWLSEKDVPIIVNVCGHAAEEYRSVIERLESEPAVSAYELNISCPNVDAGGMAFGTDCESAARIVSLCRAATRRPLIVKLTPNVTDVTAVARSVEDAGADAVSLINTLLGMSIDARTMRPRLGRVVGGLSGPAIKPIALRMVFQVSRAVEIPVLGMGGISSAEDAIEFMLAGATAVAVGTATFSDPMTAPNVISGIESYCRSREIARVSDLTGALRL